jgi:fluoride exporter
VVVLLTEWTTAHPLARPFLTTGVLGGFTTFSTFATDAEELLRLDHPATALGYLVGTPVAAVAATWVGVRLARAAGRRR